MSLRINECAKFSLCSLNGGLISLGYWDGRLHPTNHKSHLTWCRAWKCCQWWISAKANGHNALMNGFSGDYHYSLFIWKGWTSLLYFCFSWQRHTGVLSCSYLGKKADRLKNSYLSWDWSIIDSVEFTVNSSARCLVGIPEMGTLVGLPSPTSHAETASFGRGDGISLLHLLDCLPWNLGLT